MSQKSDLLNDCLESLPQDKELESLSRDCSEEEAEELHLLLKTAGALKRYAETIKPRPQFIARIQANLEEACALKYDSRKIGIASIFKPVARWAISGAIAAVMALFTFTGGFALADVASKNTMPGQTLYPVKLAVEKVKAALDLPGSREPSQVEETRIGETSDAIRTIGPVDLETVLEESGNNIHGVEKTNHSAGTESAPGKQPPAGGSAETGEKANKGKSESAPGQKSPTSDGTGTSEKTNNGKSESAPGQQSPAGGSVETGEMTNNGKSEAASGHQPPASDGTGTGEKAKPGKN